MKRPGRWPLALIAAPAAVAIWSGWVGLGAMCGFGPVNLLPGIMGGFTLNTAITLPVGVEAYAAYALSVWLWPGAPDGVKRFAGWSALGALAYGMLGQVAFHLLRSHGYTVAPVPVVVLVSCMPVAVLGLAAYLTHLLGLPADVAGEHSPVSEPDGSPATRPVTAAVTPTVTVPSISEIRARRDCSPKTAQKVQAELRRLIRSLPDPPAGAARPGNPNAPAGATPDPPAGHDKAAPAGARLGPAPDGAVHQAPAGANLNGRG